MVEVPENVLRLAPEFLVEKTEFERSWQKKNSVFMK